MSDPASAGARRRVLLGALAMVTATVCFVSLDSILKLLVARHDVLFLAWGRNLFQVLYLMALMPVLGLRRMVVTRHPVAQIGRGGLLVATTVLIVLALKHMPLAQAYAVTFSAPLIATLLASLLLGERVSPLRWAWIVAGFGGVLVALQPGAPSAGAHLLLPLAMAVANACFHVLTRAIAADEDPLALLFLVALVALGFTSLALPWSWSAMAPAEWGLLALGGVFGTLAHLLLIQAYRLAPTAIVAPMIYAQIVAAGVIGYAVFGEVPTAATLLGAAIVVASGVMLLRTRG